MFLARYSAFSPDHTDPLKKKKEPLLPPPFFEALKSPQQWKLILKFDDAGAREVLFSLPKAVNVNSLVGRGGVGGWGDYLKMKLVWVWRSFRMACAAL